MDLFKKCLLSIYSFPHIGLATGDGALNHNSRFFKRSLTLVTHFQQRMKKDHLFYTFVVY